LANPKGRGNYGSIGLDWRSDLRAPVPIVRLDSFLTGRIRPPRLIKVDVEGMEAAVIAGARGLFHDRLVLSIEADRPDAVAEWLPGLVEQGLACYMLFTRNVWPTNPRAAADDRRARYLSVQIFAFLGSPDTAFDDEFGAMRVRTMDEVRTRLQPGSGRTDSP
jgi:hypothetical protein